MWSPIHLLQKGIESLAPKITKSNDTPRTMLIYHDITSTQITNISNQITFTKLILHFKPTNLLPKKINKRRKWGNKGAAQGKR